MKIEAFFRAVVVLACLGSGTLAAQPKVVVSIAPLHSLVAALMEGAGAPVLLVAPETPPETALSSAQKLNLITADLLVWAGPGLETAMREALERLPTLENRLLTLSSHVPLLGRPGADLYAPRHVRADPAFWRDPRLAIAAVHYTDSQTRSPGPGQSAALPGQRNRPGATLARARKRNRGKPGFDSRPARERPGRRRPLLFPSVSGPRDQARALRFQPGRIRQAWGLPCRYGAGRCRGRLLL